MQIKPIDLIKSQYPNSILITDRNYIPTYLKGENGDIVLSVNSRGEIIWRDVSDLDITAIQDLLAVLIQGNDGGGLTIENIANPINPQDVATKDYVDSVAVGTNLNVASITSTTLDVTSSTGTDATLPQATTTNAGLLSAADKIQINNIIAMAVAL